MVERGNLVMSHKDEGYIQTMKPDKETKMQTMMNTMSGSRVAIVRKGHHFVVEIKIANKEDEYIVPKKIAARRWSSGRKMDVDAGTLKAKTNMER